MKKKKRMVYVIGIPPKKTEPEWSYMMDVMYRRNDTEPWSTHRTSRYAESRRVVLRFAREDAAKTEFKTLHLHEPNHKIVRRPLAVVLEYEEMLNQRDQTRRAAKLRAKEIKMSERAAKWLKQHRQRRKYKRPFRRISNAL